MNLLCFGDSITHGAWDPEGGWVARIRKRLDSMYLKRQIDSMVLTYNCGVSGDTSEGLLRRFDAEIYARTEAIAEKAAILISIGSNDAAWIKSKNDHWVTAEDYERNLMQIIESAVKCSNHVVVIGSPAVDECKTHPLQYAPDIEVSNEHVKQYEAISQTIASRLGASFVGVFDEFAKHDPSALVNEDGLHPNEAGHRLIASLVWPALTPIVQPWLTDPTTNLDISF